MAGKDKEIVDACHPFLVIDFFLKTVIYLISCIRTKLLLMTCLEVIAYVVSVSRAAISSYLCLCQYASYILSTAIVYLGLIVKKLSTLEVFKPLCVCLSVCASSARLSRSCRNICVSAMSENRRCR